MPGEPVHIAGYQSLDGVAAACVVLSLALFAYLRTGNRRPTFVADLALGYMVLMAFALGVVIHYGSADAEPLTATPMITWVGPMILMFAAILPAPPAKMLAAGLLAASMDSIGMVIWGALGHVRFGPMSNALVMHYPNFLLLGVAVVVSHVVTRLGHQVAKEREMGSYRLDELLGRGGMGEVYRATHRMLARPRGDQADPARGARRGRPGQGRDRGRQVPARGRGGRQFTSPHTVELYDFGVTDEGTLYLVMELLQGTNLEVAGPPRRSGARGEGRTHPLPGLRFALGGAHGWSGPPRHQAGQHPPGLHRRPRGVRQGARFRPREGDWGAGAGRDAGRSRGDDSWNPRLHGPRDPARRAGGRASGSLCPRVRRDYLLTAHLVFEAETTLQMVLKHLQQEPELPSKRTTNPISRPSSGIVL